MNIKSSFPIPNTSLSRMNITSLSIKCNYEANNEIMYEILIENQGWRRVNQIKPETENLLNENEGK